MAETKSDTKETIEPEGIATTPAAVPTSKPMGIAAIPSNRVKIGSEPDPQSKGQRRHLRRQKEAGKAKVPSRRSQVSR